MKRFIYAYKTSDGIRHESWMEAETKEKVFEQLRKVGIRPIKVIDPDTLPEAQARRRVKRFLLWATLGIIAIAFVWFEVPRSESSELKRLRDHAQSIEMKLDSICLNSGEDSESIWQRVEDVRYEAMEAFRNIREDLPSYEVRTAKQLYGDLMLKFDDTLSLISEE